MNKPLETRSKYCFIIHLRERERKRREAEEERAIEEAISEVREARRKAASRAAKQRRGACAYDVCFGQENKGGCLDYILTRGRE